MGEELNVRVDDVQIVYESHGREGPTLLCLPGWCDSRSVFRPLAGELSSEARLILLDWRGHGESGSPTDDFGTAALVEDAMAAVEASGAASVVPVSVSHAGWVVLELRRRLGERISGAVLMDWIVLEPPRAFREVLSGLQDEARWQEVRDGLLRAWLGGIEAPAVERHLFDVMASYGSDMWGRAARSIVEAYREEGDPLGAFARLEPPLDVLHLYAQPREDVYLAAQQVFAEAHPWFHVERLDAATHFPVLEDPPQVARHVREYLARTKGMR